MAGAGMHELPPIDTEPLAGDEPFHAEGNRLGFDLRDFWQWSASDVVSNATRGVVAEYLVAQALGVAVGNVREEWAAFDLELPNGTRIEVKSAAYIQSWYQKELSIISFGVRKTRAWDKKTNTQSEEKRRQADVYVFALLAHTDQNTLDPLDVCQWQFFVLPTVTLDRRERSQESITLPSLHKLTRAITFSEIGSAVEEASRIQKVG